jgi:predicted esterase
MKYLFLIAAIIFFAGCKTESSNIELLNQWLQQSPAPGSLSGRPFATKPLSKEEAQEALGLIHSHLKNELRAKYTEEWENKTLTWGRHNLMFVYKKFGEKPPEGWSLYISMHGGGNTTGEMNDRQWQNQINLYRPHEGIYMAPRAPDNSWNMWHQPHVDSLFSLFIKLAGVFEDINTNRVYLTGYSAGGDGTYQLAPRMADRLAAAAMMAGHPNDASPVSLRNLPFAIHMGGEDAAYNRNGIAAEWGQQLAELQQNDPLGYEHEVHIYEGLGHWMDKRDTAAIDWMAGFTRNPYPEKIVWSQNGKEHNQFYWIALQEDNPRYDASVIASREGQKIYIEEARNAVELIIYLNDEMLDLDQKVDVEYEGEIIYSKKPERSITTIWETMYSRNDPNQVFSARIEVSLN